MIEKETILSHTNRGLNVFSHYLGFEVNTHRNFRSPFYEDKRASCHIFYDRKVDMYKFYDHGDSNYSGDCFWFVAQLNGLNVKRDFSEVLSIIVKDLGIYVSDYTNQSSFDSQSYNKTKPVYNHISSKENEKPYKAEYSTFDDYALNYWQHYGITEKILKKFNVRCLKSYQGCTLEGNTFYLHSNPSEPMFGYLGNKHIKLYRPNSSKMRFLYGGQLPTPYCFGLEQLSTKGDILFITGGEKDVLSLSAHGFNAICFNSETAQIPEGIIESLQLRFRHIVILYDVDETGLREAQRQVENLTEYKVISLTLPLNGTKTEKDISDYFALGHSADDLKKLLTDMFTNLYSQTMMLL